MQSIHWIHASVHCNPEPFGLRYQLTEDDLHKARVLVKAAKLHWIKKRGAGWCWCTVNTKKIQEVLFPARASQFGAAEITSHIYSLYEQLDKMSEGDM